MPERKIHVHRTHEQLSGIRTCVLNVDYQSGKDTVKTVHVGDKHSRVADGHIAYYTRIRNISLSKLQHSICNI